MSFYNSASGNSFWNGYDYYTQKRVISYKKIGDNLYSGVVKGTIEYHVTIDLIHPTKSTCDCPYAEGRRVLCKHKIALYFAIFPDEAKKVMKQQEDQKNATEEEKREMIEVIKKHVLTLSKEELQKQLLSYLIMDALKDFDHQNGYEDDDDYDDWHNHW